MAEVADRLAWLYNQLLPQVPIGTLPWTFTVNQVAWEWPVPVEDYPEAWTRLPQRGLWLQGDLAARPTGE